MTTDTLTRGAQTRPNSFDPDTRTVSAVIASPTPVRRRDARGPYLEVLTADTLDLSTAEGLPVLDSHRTASVRDALGRVRSIALEGGSVTAVLELTAAEDAAPVVQRIADGTVSGVSIGYRVAGWTEKQTQAGRVKNPTRWQITEVTLTSNPADPSARLRQQEESPMPDDITETVSPDVAEQTRRRDIRALVRTAGLDAQVADDLIDAGADMTRAKAEIFDAMQERRRAAPIIRSHAPANDDPATVIRRQSDALAFRMGGGGEPAEDVRPFLNLSLRDMAVDSLTRAGVSTRGMSADEVFTRAGEHTTSDFALTVSNAMGKVALDTYKAAESPLKTLCRQRTLPNFKDSTSIRLGEMGRLEELAESGEITHTSRAESGETMRLKTFARGVTVSRKLMIDDDLGLLGDMTAALGEAAAQTEADILVTLLTGNPNLSDGTPVFDATRGNLGNAGGGSAGAIGSAGVDVFTDARQAMRTVKGMDGKTIVGAAPRFMIVGPEIETLAEQILAETYPTKSDEVNVAASKMTLLVEPRLEGDAVYIFADPARLAAMQYAYLSSAQGVQIQRTEAWDTLGMKFRAFLDFGAGWLDWRGAYLHEGS
ncbi:peptidase [Sinirhodobacter ferrireducens]|uniref:Peptidase n=1 Tax=Paenirhodobacter ferrireducens TaxID=1215032 RepID=A0A443L7Q1_9RHOB|nr:prohead protease/major capsid protein fusion protein [Sinirhodobacter ferrireducens]RWR45103.1 peptidase [Sinirhodobacter ferrireducens]